MNRCPVFARIRTTKNGRRLKLAKLDRFSSELYFATSADARQAVSEWRPGPVKSSPWMKSPLD